VLTDASNNHLAGMIPVVERYTVGWVLDAVYECDSSECRAWQAALQQRGWSVQHPIAGTRIDMGEGVLLTVLYPPGDRDEGPMVLRLEYGSTCFLLAGGAGEQVQATLVGDRAEMRCEVLHLERTAGNLDFLEAVNPGLVILSEDDGDSYPLALEEWIRRGAQVRYTGAVGSVEVISDGHSCRLERGR
jgi:beta-lactamase superfamily II metal-dependent hydrolase